MDNEDLILEQRGVCLDISDEYEKAVLDEFIRLSGVSFKHAKNEEQLIELCYSYEPMLIVASLNEAAAKILSSAAQIKRFRRTICLAFDKDGCGRWSGLEEDMTVTEIVPLTGGAHYDAVSVLRAYKKHLKCGMNLRTLTDRMPLVNEAVWHDPSADDRFLYGAISDRLERLGVKKSLLGHKYLIAAIALQSVTYCAPEPHKLYSKVAAYYDTTPGAVEKAIRYAVETAWTRGDIDYQHAMFGMSIDEERGKPTNAEFVARLALSF